ncbi:MAG: TetR/AcrR family transcriptional regulator [Anaerolineales bacterium]|nr:TetR/AcrR family transcriptional regulator [Anaerolineales bacterium]
MSPRPDVSDERKDQIIHAATNVFTRKGFHDARMDDIVKETGLSKGALYWYFKSKEDLIIAILDRIFSAEFQQMESLNDESLPARECLSEFLDVFLDELRRMKRVTPIISEFYALAFRNKTVRTVMQRYLRTFVTIMEPIIRRGMDRGEFRPGDARQVTVAIGAQLEGTLLLWAYAPKMVPLEDQLRAGAEMLIRSMEAAPKNED